VSVRVESRSHRPAKSVALLGAGRGNFQAVKDVDGPRARKTVFFGLYRQDSAATAVNPVGGDDGLICGNDGDVLPVKNLRTTPRLQRQRIDGRPFANEGGGDFDFFCAGAAVQGSFALATGDSQGLLQLVRAKGTWKVDRRVHSPGRNDAGLRHQRGWIDFRDSTTSAALFEDVAIAPRPLPGHGFPAVALDRVDGSLVVIDGAGTAHPHVLGSLQDDSLSNGEITKGNGGIAFLPGSRDRAVVLTQTGVDVLSLRDPSTPRLRVPTTVGDGLTQPTSVAVSSDGDHLAVAAGQTVYGYAGLHGAAVHGSPLTPQTSFVLGSAPGELVTDVAYTARDTLVVLHGRSGSGTRWHLTLVKRVPEGHHAVRGSTPTSQPDGPGSLSVWPAP
jgi:hypothetical protein